MTALRIDDHLAEAHASLGHLRTRQWDWSGAEKELKRAIELNPNYAIGHTWYAVYLTEIGQFDKAFVELNRARTLEPVSPIIECTEGALFYLARRYDQAIERFQRTLELDAGFALAHSFLGFALEAKGNYQEAVTEYQWAISVLGNLPELVSCLGRVHALAGRTKQALEAIDELRCRSGQRPGQPALIALSYTALGDKDEALQWLETASAERDPDLCLLKVDPRLDSLRGDPRFMSLLERVGLANPNHLVLALHE